MVLLEAMAFKKPIVSMSVGSISEVINNDTGILVNSGDYDKFINELIKIKNNKELSIICGDNAFKIVEEKFSIKNYVKEILNVYENEAMKE